MKTIDAPDSFKLQLQYELTNWQADDSFLHIASQLAEDNIFDEQQKQEALAYIQELNETHADYDALLVLLSSLK